MATLEEHKAQVKIDKPEGTVKVNKNGVDVLIEGDEYNAWVDDVAASRLDEEQNGWEQNRIREYLSIEQQLDMQYWDNVNGTTTWKDHIAQVKSDNPKPSE